MEVSHKILMKIQKILNDTIENLLYGGCSDPGTSELEGAACCFKTLKLLGLKVKDEANRRMELEGDNLYNENFLK